MSLEEYRKKRDLRLSTEPQAIVKPGEGPLRFVVQKHDASHLHYDFRLELGGVLKSWAVPKGPSLNPTEKRLAVMTEDHPMDYLTFEGVIPEGNYGAGTVMVWDIGDYCPVQTCELEEAERILAAELAKGHLSFILNGHRLHGRFALVRMRHTSDENVWLLFKADDEFATDEDVLREDASVLSGRFTCQISAETSSSGEVWTPAEHTALPDLTGAEKAPMPHDVSPMLAALADEPFDQPDWLFELKWDGYRAIAELQPGKVRLYSRNNRTFNDRFPAIVQSLPRIGYETVLDGEIVVVDESGVSQFQLLQRYLQTKRGTLVYYVFDILYLEGHDLRSLPLIRRKEILKSILPDLPNIKLSDYIDEHGLALFREASIRGIEGVIGKKADSPYRSGVRSSEWQKVRARLHEEFVIGGYTDPRGGRIHFGALVLGVFEDDKLIYVGHAGSGLDEKGLTFLYSKLYPLERPISPFAIPPKTNMPVHWVEPVLVCEVEFHGWTEDGLLRQPVIIGLREDKSAREVRREVPRPVDRPRGMYAEKPQGSHDMEVVINGHTLKLTNLNKVFWPDEGYTKGDLIDYYRDIAEYILPHVVDRPESLNRHPDGITGESFFQKNVDNELVPDWANTVKIPSEESARGIINYILCQDEATLVFLANLGCIELNPWSSRVRSPDSPDYTIIDLDPLEVDFDKVIEAAQVVKDILEEIGIEGFPKTSGATGLHIYIPLGGKYTYDQARDFARIIALLANNRLPGITSVERSPARRRGKVYLDYLQNGRGKTVASDYCVRPQPHAPVSTPLHWYEVREGLDPTVFNIHTIGERLKRTGDIFKPVLGTGIDITASLDKLASLPNAAYPSNS